MAPVQIGEIVAVHSDARRTISEFNGADFSVQSFGIHDVLPLGNHYHEKKDETFVITAGGGLLFVKDARGDAAVEVHLLKGGSVVKIPPFVAHTFMLRHGSSMTCLSSAPFNPEDKDMIAYPVKPALTHIAAVGIIYRQRDPWQIYLDVKDNGLPVKVFRGTMCFVGGNWIGEGAREDANPLETFKRELLEELSFDKPVRSSAELEALGLAETLSFQPVASTGAEPDDADNADLSALKDAIVKKAAPFGDFIVSVPKSVLDQGDPDNTRPGFTYLVSYYEIGLDEADWAMLERLQRKFGNLSNESVSAIVSLEDIVERGIKSAYGHEHALREFFLKHRFFGGRDLPVFDGTAAYYVGDPLGSYEEYLKRYDVAKVPG